MTIDNGLVNIHGKIYKTVAKRVDEFRKDYKQDLAIITSLISIDEKTVVMKAEIIDKENFIIATGYAEENRTASQINKTSALENCETSAIGRALANFGLAGGEYASADEVANAIAQQSETPTKSNGTRLNFDEIREDIAIIDDEKSLTDYGEELKKKYQMTAKQANAISQMFNQRREELKQNASD